MKSPSDDQITIDVDNQSSDKNAERLVKSALDQSVTNLSAQTLSEITQARNEALYVLKTSVESNSVSARSSHFLIQPFPRIAITVAATLIIAVSINYQFINSVPEIPLAIATDDGKLARIDELAARLEQTLVELAELRRS